MLRGGPIEFVPDNSKRIEEGLWELYTYHIDYIRELERAGYNFKKNFLTHYCQLDGSKATLNFGGRAVCLMCKEPLPEDLLSIISLLGWTD